MNQEDFDLSELTADGLENGRLSTFAAEYIKAMDLMANRKAQSTNQGLVAAVHGVADLRRDMGRLVNEEADFLEGQILEPNRGTSAIELAAQVHRLGVAHQAMGRFLQAETAFLAANFLMNLPDAGVSSKAQSTTYQQIGIVRWQMGRLQEAEDAFHEALLHVLNAGTESRHRNAAELVMQLGHVRRDKGLYSDALTTYIEARALMELSDPGMTAGQFADIRHHIGVVRHMMKDFPGAEAIYRDSLALRRFAPDPYGELDTLGMLCQLLRETQPEREAQHLESLVRILSNRLDSLVTDADRLRLSTNYGKFPVRLCCRQAIEAGAFLGLETLERFRGRSLCLGLSEQEQQEIISLSGYIEEWRAELGVTEDPNEQAKLQAHIGRNERLIAEIRDTADVVPHFAIADLLKKLEEDDLYLSYVPTEDQTLLFMVQASGTQCFRCDVGLEALRVDGQLVRQSWATLIRPARGVQLVGNNFDLTTALIPEPVRKAIKKASRVWITPADMLWDLPFEDLEDEQGRVFADKGVCYTPSLRSVVMVMGRGHSSSSGGAVFAINNFKDPSLKEPLSNDIDLPECPPSPESKPGTKTAEDCAARMRGGSRNLRYSIAEGMSVAHRHEAKRPPPITRLGSEATKAHFKAIFGQVAWLHISTHASAAPHPLECVLVLQPVNSDIGRLTVEEMFREKLTTNAKLIVLSCCEAGAGPSQGSEGRVSLAYALLRCGARCVVATRWTAIDGPTSQIMAQFHHYLAEENTVCAALEKAKDWARATSGLQDPYYWANFAVYGDGTVRI